MKNLLGLTLKFWERFVHEVKSFSHRLLYVIFLSLITPVILFGQTVVGTIQRPGFIPFSLGIYEGGNKLFVSDWDSDNLLIYDCTTLELISELDLGANGVGMMVVHESTGKVYLDVHINDIKKIAVINANTNELLRIIDGVYGTLRIDEDLGKVYVLDRSSLNGNLYIIDIETDTVNTVQLTGGGFYSNIKVNPVTHEVFIGYLSVGAEKLDIVDGNTMTRTTIDAPNGWDLAVNWLENKVYIIPGPLNRYWIYDRNIGSTLEITDCYNDATEIFFNPAGNRIYTSSEINRYSTIFEGETDSCFNLPMYGATTRVAFRHATNHVYYVGMDNIVVMDDNTQLLVQFPNIWLKTTGNSIKINQSTGRVFVNYYKNDPQASNTIVVLQDTEMIIRPPVFVVGRVLDPISKVVTGYWSAGFISQGATIRPGGGRVYAAGYSRGGLVIHAGCGGSNSKIASLTTGGSYPTVPVITPDGSRIYVTNSGSDANNVGVIDAVLHNVITTIPVGSKPWGADITPDGSKLYVANQQDNTVSVINTFSNTVESTIPVGANPWGITINPCGTKAYIANSGSGTVSVIDVSSNTVAATITVGSTPHWLTITPNAKHVYVGNWASGSVSVIESGTDSVIQTIKVGNNPEGIDVLPNGSEVYVFNSSISDTSSISVINTSTFLVDTTLSVPYIYDSIVLAIADPTSRFAGRITSSGVQVNNALIRALQAGVEKGNASTNAAGDYSVFNLKPGTYDIEVSAPGYYSQILSTQNVNIGNTAVLNFNLILTGIAFDENKPKKFSLNQNYPNPFNSNTIIKYSILKSCNIALKIYNLKGQEIYTLEDGYHSAGVHKFKWTAEGLPSGIYFYRLHAGDFSETKKLILQK